MLRAWLGGARVAPEDCWNCPGEGWVAGVTVVGAGKGRGGQQQGELCRLAGKDCAWLAHGEEGSSRGQE